MKILKDKMPEHPSNCTFAALARYRGYYICLVPKFGTYPCVLEQKGKCPYLTTDPSEGV